MPETKVLQGNLSEEHWVIKPLPLTFMEKIPFSLGELKLIDVYLSRINIRDPAHRTVVFTKKEFEELFGITKINSEVMRRYTMSLLSKPVSIPKRENFRGWKNVSIFEVAEYSENEYGEASVALMCTPTAKKLFFDDAEKVGYLKYLLKNSKKLNSRYAFLLFNYLTKNRYRGKWTETVEKIKFDVFDIDLNENPTYDENKYFKRDILDKALKEVNENTDIKFKCKLERQGKHVIGITFTIEKVFEEPPSLSEIDQMTLDGFDDEANEDELEKNIELLRDSCEKAFDIYEMNELLQIIITKELPENQDGVWIVRYHYLAELYSRLKRYEKRKKITDRFEYFKTMVKNDIIKDK